MEAIVVLAHLMSRTGRLDRESRARADKAIELASTIEPPFIITTGWSYRTDSLIPIGKAMQKYIGVHSRIGKDRILSDVRSKDTVGDAVFSKDLLIAVGDVNSVIVVTSNYHSPRAEEIFNFVYGKSVTIKMAPVPWASTTQVQENEANSLAAFRETFHGINSGDTIGIKQRLLDQHPLYTSN